MPAFAGAEGLGKTLSAPAKAGSLLLVSPGLQSWELCNNAISKSSEDQIVGDDLLRLVKELYGAGAIEVRVIGLTIEEDFEDGNGLEVTLPQDKAERAALFAITGRVLREISSAYDQDEEQGQASTGIAW